ncbi:MAG TPA: glycosyltransferase, partial [Planctomycetota bacterium]|nr:glycosyltransferase [Planctomycetota bacterium]
VPADFDLYLGASGWKQVIPPRRKRKGGSRVGIHVNPCGPTRVGSVEGGPPIEEREDSIRWVLAQEPDFVYCYTTDRFKEDYYGYWIRKHGIPVVGLPAAADVTVYRPRPSEERFRCDIGWVGGRWPYKAAMLDRYLVPLFRWRCLVFGWGDTWKNRQTISDSDVPVLFASARLCPGISEAHSVLHPIDIPERVFKIPASGGFTIHTPSPAIPDLFGDVVPTARDDREWLGMVEHYLSDDKARIELAARQREEVLRRHTYFDRCVGIAAALGDGGLADALMKAKTGFVKPG